MRSGMRELPMLEHQGGRDMLRSAVVTRSWNVVVCVGVGFVLAGCGTLFAAKADPPEVTALFNEAGKLEANGEYGAALDKQDQAVQLLIKARGPKDERVNARLLQMAETAWNKLSDRTRAEGYVTRVQVDGGKRFGFGVGDLNT